MRFFLEWFGASRYNPICVWLLKLTNPLVKPMQKLLPVRSSINWACIAVIVIIKLIELTILIWLQIQTFPHVGGLVILGLGTLVYLSLEIFFWALILQAVSSWVHLATRRFTPIHEVLYVLTTPILRPIQRILPPLGGLDLSPIPALIIIKLINLYVVSQIIAIGINLLLQ